MKMINLGCGKIYHSDWVNVDLISETEEVTAVDIRQTLPYPDDFFDACYSSHLLEHLKVPEASQFLQECWRILKPGGVIRIVVPDLEKMARIYLKLLDELQSGHQELEANYDWIMLELYDQVVRHYAGGEMKLYLTNPHLSNHDFILSRIGQEALSYCEGSTRQHSLWQKLQNKSLGWGWQKFRLFLAQTMVKLIGGKAIEQAFKEGIMRNSGEIHRWMYDSFSLQRQLAKTGFTEICVCQAENSRIPSFKDYQLDTINGKIRKPDSLFMEGVKP